MPTSKWLYFLLCFFLQVASVPQISFDAEEGSLSIGVGLMGEKKKTCNVHHYHEAL